MNVRPPVGNFAQFSPKIAHRRPNFHGINRFWWITLETVQDRAKIHQNDLNYF